MMKTSMMVLIDNMIFTANRKRNCYLSSGFTLIELLAVMSIMIIILGTSIASFYGFGRGARLSGAINALRGKISLARQFAILQSTDVEVRFGTPNDSQHYFYVWDAGNDYSIGETNFLPVGVKFGDLSELVDGEHIPFNSMGNSGSTDTYNVEVIEEDDEDHPVVLEVYGITGLVQVEEL